MDIKIKHLIEYLQKFDQETSVALDHDGWREDEIKPKNEIQLIEERGIFYMFHSKKNGTNTLFINN